MLTGQRERDLERLAPKVLAGVLPRLYPQMLEVAYAHQDAGRPVYICTAATQAGSTAMARASAVTIGISMALAADPPPVRKPPVAANGGTLSAAPRPATARRASAIVPAMPEPT